MKKLLLISAFALSLPITSFAAPSKSNTTMAVNYENPQQLINNYYAAQEFCRSSTKENDPETTIMCNYRDAADTKLNQLGYCFGDNDEQSNAEREWKKCSQQSKKIKSTATTAAQTTTVSEAVINEAIQDIENTCYQHGFDGFAQNVLNCFSTRSGPPLQKCMLEDLAFISFYSNLIQSFKTKNGYLPNNIEIPFFSGSDILYRERVYYFPIFKSLENAAIFFKPGLERTEEALAKCSLKIMDEAKKLPH